MESIDSIDERENDMQVLLEKQDSQFTALTEALKDSLKDNGERRVGPAKLPSNPNKKRIISQNDDSLSLFAPSDVEEDLQLKKVMFVVSDTEPQSEGHTDDVDDILCELTEEFNKEKLCDPKINPSLAKAINEVWGKKLTLKKLKIRLNKHLKPENSNQLSPTLVNMEIFSNIPAHGRSQDVKLQKMQKFLLKSAYPIVKILDSVLASSSSSNNKPDHMLINKIKELALILWQCSIRAIKSYYNKGEILLQKI